MGWLLSEGTVVVVAALAVLLCLSAGLRRGLLVAGRGAAHRVAAARPRHEEPSGRPIEVVVHEVRRLRARYAATRRGVSFAKSEAVRRAYDDALAECCAALGITHLLGVVDDVPERDAERARVERLLHVWGVDLEQPPSAA